MAFVGATFESFMRYNAERGEYGPGDVEELVAERMRLARHFTPHYTERDRPDGQILAVRGEPLPHNGFVTLYTDITASRRYEQQIQQQNAELERRVAERTHELQATNRRLIVADDANQRITEALRRSEENLRLITDTVPALIGYFDHQEIYRYVNKGYADWFGCRQGRRAGPLHSRRGGRRGLYRHFAPCASGARRASASATSTPCTAPADGWCMRAANSCPSWTPRAGWPGVLCCRSTSPTSRMPRRRWCMRKKWRRSGS